MSRRTRATPVTAIAGVAWWLLTVLVSVTVTVGAPACAADTVVYYHTDALRSVAVVTSATGQIIERTYSAPYGQVLNRPLRDGPGYTGHREDAETGLVYMQQRYYDPERGRFLSVDPVDANADTGANFNRYWYANDNPYRYTDPFGMCTGSHISNSDGTCVSTGGYTTGTAGAAQGMRRQAALSNALAEYKPVIQYGYINVDANVREAQDLGRKHDASGFIDNVGTGGKWDYKNDKAFSNFNNKQLLAEFGNVHLGIVAHAFGFTLGMTIGGAGSYQSLSQGHSPGRRFSGSTNFWLSMTMMSAPLNGALYTFIDPVARFEAGFGLRFGDYPEDTSAVITGYDYYGEHYEH